MAQNLITLASDSFTRAASNNLGPTWVQGVVANFVRILSNQAISANGSSNAYALFIGDRNWPNDQFSKLTIAARANNSCIVMTGVHTSLTQGLGGYFGGAFTAGTPANYQIIRAWAGTSSVLASSTAPVTAGDTIALSSQWTPTGILLSLYQNSNPIPILTFTDSFTLGFPYTGFGSGQVAGAVLSGFPGIWIASDATNTHAAATNWSAGVVQNPPIVVNNSTSLSLRSAQSIGVLTALNQAVQFTIPQYTEAFLGRMQLVVTSGQVNFPVWCLECSQDGGTSWFTVPAATVPNLTPMLSDTPSVFSAWYEISGLGGAIFRFGLSQGTNISSLVVNALVG